jgi:hypothetical protein
MATIVDYLPTVIVVIVWTVGVTKWATAGLSTLDGRITGHERECAQRRKNDDERHDRLEAAIHDVLTTIGNLRELTPQIRALDARLTEFTSGANNELSKLNSTLTTLLISLGKRPGHD